MNILLRGLMLILTVNKRVVPEWMLILERSAPTLKVIFNFVDNSSVWQILNNLGLFDV